MAIDPNLPLQVKQASFRPFGDYVEEGMQARDLSDQRNLRAVQLENARAETEMRKTQQSTAQLALKREQRAQTLDEAKAKASQVAFKVGERGEFDFDDDLYAKTLADAGYGAEADAHLRLSQKEQADLRRSLRLDLEASTKEASEQAKRLAGIWLPLMRPGTTPEQRATMYDSALRRSRTVKGFEDFELDPKYIPQTSDYKIQQIIDTAEDDPAEAWYNESKRKREEEESIARLEKAQHEAEMAKSAFYARLFGGARDQVAWDKALEQLDPTEAAKMPKQYSEANRQSILSRGLDPKDIAAGEETPKDLEELAVIASGTDPVRAKIAKDALELLKQREIEIARAKSDKSAGGIDFDGRGGGALNDAGFDESALEGIDEGTVAQVRQVIRGQIPYPSGSQARDPHWNAVMRLASLYEPGFDAARYKLRTDTLKDFKSGRAANNISSLNTVIGHIDEMEKTVDKLGNWDFIPILNRPKNWFLGKVSSNKESVLNQLQLKKQAVVEELERAFRGAAGSATGIAAWERSFDSASSTQALKDTIEAAIDLLGSRVEALAQQYKRGVPFEPDFNFFDPKPRAILERLRPGWVEEIDPKVANAQGRQTATPAAPTGPSEADIRAIMSLNPGATREEAIEALRGQ